MSRIAIIPAHVDHVPVLARAMRGADRAEVAALGHTPAGALELSLRAAAEAWTGTVDDEPAVMFGVADLGEGIGEPWLLGTERVVRHQVAFLRRNRAYVDRLLMPGRWSTLRNRVDSRNEVSLRWLSWLGFVLGPAEPWGPRHLPFHPFWRSA